MTARTCLVGLLLLATVTACTPRRTIEPVSPDQLSIYAAILEAATEGLRETTAVVVEPKLRALPSDAPLMAEIPDVPGLAESFAEANADAARLSPQDAQLLGIRIFEAERFPREDWGTNLNGWYAAVAGYYGGQGVRIVYLTRPGISIDGDSAVISYSVGCGALCGEGRLAVLERQGGRWRIVANRLLTVS